MTDAPLDGPSRPVRGRIEVPPDPRDLPGEFAHRLEVVVRFGDTDAMGHANNARFLTYCESARIDYWETATGEPFGLATHGESESMILADIRVTFRSPAFFGEVLTVESRLGPDRPDELHARAPDHRLGVGPRRGAARRHGRGRPGAVRLRDGPAAAGPRRRRRPPRGLRGPPAPRLSSGADAAGGYASKRRKIATAFWPPNPKPLTATVSTFAWRATSGT